MTVDEFHVAQLFMIMRASEEETGNGEGVEILKNEPYDNTDGHLDISTITGWPVPRNKGQYTLKHYHIASKLPIYVSSMVPTDAMLLIEESYNGFPDCITVLMNAYLAKNRFYIAIESKHVMNDHGSQDNLFQLTQDELAQRSIHV